jgi:hypothetical protein
MKKVMLRTQLRFPAVVGLIYRFTVALAVEPDSSPVALKAPGLAPAVGFALYCNIEESP